MNLAKKQCLVLLEIQLITWVKPIICWNPAKDQLMLFSVRDIFEWYLCFTYDRGPRFPILHRLVQEPGGHNGAISSVGVDWHHQQLLTPFFQKFGSCSRHRGFWEDKENDLKIQIFVETVTAHLFTIVIIIFLKENTYRPLIVRLNLRESWPPLVDTLHSHSPPCWELRLWISNRAVLLFESMMVWEAWE